MRVWSILEPGTQREFAFHSCLLYTPHHMCRAGMHRKSNLRCRSGGGEQSSCGTIENPTWDPSSLQNESLSHYGRAANSVQVNRCRGRELNKFLSTPSDLYTDSPRLNNVSIYNLVHLKSFRL